MHLKSESEEERDSWIKAIEEAKHKALNDSANMQDDPEMAPFKENLY